MSEHLSKTLYNFLKWFRSEAYELSRDKDNYKQIFRWTITVVQTLYKAGAKINRKIILAAAETSMSLGLSGIEEGWDVFQEVCKPLQDLTEEERRTCLKGCIERLMDINDEYFTAHISCDPEEEEVLDLEELRSKQNDSQYTCTSDNAVLFDIRIYELLLDMGAPVPTFPVKLEIDDTTCEITLEGLKEREPELYAKLCKA